MAMSKVAMIDGVGDEFADDADSTMELYIAFKANVLTPEPCEEYDLGMIFDDQMFQIVFQGGNVPWAGEYVPGHLDNKIFHKGLIPLKICHRGNGNMIHWFVNAKEKNGVGNAHGVFLVTLSSAAMAMLLSHGYVFPRFAQGGYDFKCPIDDALIQLTDATVTYKTLGVDAARLNAHAAQFYQAVQNARAGADAEMSG